MFVGVYFIKFASKSGTMKRTPENPFKPRLQPMPQARERKVAALKASFAKQAFAYKKKKSLKAKSARLPALFASAVLSN